VSELRVAVYSDVHGNLPALDATLAAIERRGPWYRVIAAGDHCLSGPDPATALTRVLERSTDVLQGNTDRDIVDSGASDPELGDKKRAAIAWTRARLGAAGIRTLDSLPFEARVFAPDGSSMLVVHANPRDLDQHMFLDMPRAQLRALVGDVDADVLAFGHLHIPFRRTLGRLRLFDIASCGAPRDGDRRAVWGEFTWQADDGWRGQIRRVAYDYGETVLRMLACGMPNPDKRIRDLLRATYE
jgi:predicted phosphodiesterase